MRLICGSKSLDLSHPRIMGIVNVTPDSFSDGGQYHNLSVAVAHAQQLISDGADIIDIGGESTRPGANPVDLEEELARVIPVITALRGCAAVISIDTRHPEVMQAAIDAGAEMVNDVYALRAAGALDVIKQTNVAVCLMHMQGEPKSMQQHIYYDDVVTVVRTFLQQRIACLDAAGVGRERIVIDPGFGFGKTVQDNLQLLKHLDVFAGLKLPVLAGLSRKAVLGKLTGRPVNEREAAGLAAHLYALKLGANIIRVHDVAGCRDALTVWQAIEEAQ